MTIFRPLLTLVVAGLLADGLQAAPPDAPKSTAPLAAGVPGETDSDRAEAKRAQGNRTGSSATTGTQAGAAATAPTGQQSASGTSSATQAGTTTTNRTGNVEAGVSAGTQGATQGNAAGQSNATNAQGNATLRGNAAVQGNATVQGNTAVQGNTSVQGGAAVAPNAAGNVNNQSGVNIQAGANLPNAAAQTSANIGLEFAQSTSSNALTISSVQQNTPLATVGLVPGDQIVSVAGQTFASPAQFTQYLYSVPVGQRVPFVVMRNGVRQTLYWTPDETFVRTFAPPPHAHVAMRAGGQGNTFGIRFDEQVQHMAWVADVAPGSPAHRAGVQRGDAVVAVNSQPVNNPAEFMAATSQIPPGPVQLELSRTRTVQLMAAGDGVVPATAIVEQPAAAVPVTPRAPVRRFFRGR